jgi:tetratricopeptide (TPR) repeat protein
MLGKSLGSYRIEGEVGAGGMGTVYRGRGPDGVEVAIKVVHPHLRSRTDFLQRFLREGEIGRKVIHENVVRTLAVESVDFEGEPLPFLVMEFVEGVTLRDLLTDLGTIPEALLREIARGIAAGLAAIHEREIIHRDLKPENVLITEDYQVRVMDLGVARLVEDTLALTREGEFAGSLYYAAPEQFSGDPVDSVADLYSIGVLLYELASGQNPFRRDDAGAVVAAHLEHTPEALARVSPELSPFLSDVVAVLLNKDPAARFPSSAVLSRTLIEGEDSDWWIARQQDQELERVRPARVLVRRETALIGRESDVAFLSEEYHSAAAGRGSVVLIEGEAGIGKTRLVDEFLSTLLPDEVHILYGAYLPSGGMGGLSDAILTSFGAAGLEQALRPYLTVTPGLVPAFAAMVRHEAPPPGCEPLQGDALHAVFVHLMQGLSREKPLVWVVDDLQFGRAESRQLVLSLARAVEDHRVELILTSRPGMAADDLSHFSRLRTLRKLELGRLSAREVIEVLNDAFRSEALAERLGGKIAYKSDGVPLFVFEMIRGLKEGRLISETPDGSFVETKVIRDIEVPSAVRDLVASRLLGISDDDRDILDVAAVQGFEFRPDLVAQVCGVKLVKVLQRLAAVERRTGVVRCGAGKVHFDHNQIQEILYEETPPDLRAEYHALTAEAIAAGEGVAGVDAEAARGETAGLLARHYLMSSRPLKARPYLKAAIDHLVEGYRNEAALDLIGLALDVPDLLEAEGRFNALRSRAACLGHLGRRREERAVLDEMLSIAGNSASRARARLELGRHLVFTYQPKEATQDLKTALALVRDLSDLKLEGAIHGQLGNAHYSLGQFADAKREYEAHLEKAEQANDRNGVAAANGSLANILSVTGRYDEAREQFEKTLAQMRETGNRRGEASALLNLGTVYTRARRTNEALPIYEQALVLVREIGYRRGIAIANGNLGIMEDQEGRLEAAMARYRQCELISRETGDVEGEVSALLNLGASYLILGALGRSEELLRRAERTAAHVGARRMAGYAAARRVSLLSIREQFEDAEELCREVIGGWEEIEYEVGVTNMRATLGYILYRLGREEEAVRELDAVLEAEPEPTKDVHLLVPLCVRALLPGGDPDRAAAALEDLEERQEMELRVFCHLQLYLARGDRSHLERGYRTLMQMRDHAPKEYRETMLTEVPVHREVVEAYRRAFGR